MNIIKELKNNNFILIKNNKQNNIQLAKKYFLDFINNIGVPIEHTIGKNDYILDIKAKKSFSDIITYSEHNEEAKYHTDAQYNNIPENFIALYCFKKARCGGGKSRIIKLQDIVTTLKKNNYEITLLKENIFPFSTPSIYQNNNKLIQYFNILSKDETFIRYRYDTIMHGIEVEKKNNIKKSIEEFDNLLENVKYKELILEEGDLLILNNHNMLHYRTQFNDLERHLFRIRFNLKPNKTERLWT